MSQTIKLPNYKSQNLFERGVLNGDHAAGSLILTLENSNRFATPYSAMIGQPVEERTEIVTLGAVIDAQHTNTSALKYSHVDDTEVYVLFGQQLCIYRAADTNGVSPVIANFSKIDTIDIDADNMMTIYTDNSIDDGAGFWYRFTYKGPTGETNLADSPAVRGGNVGVYCTIDAIKDDAGMGSALYITDDLISPHRDSAQAYINGMLGGRYVVPFPDPVNPYISDITKRLAAGYLLQAQYPANPERGQAKIDSANKDLMLITTGQMTLTNTAGLPTAPDSGTQGSYWPDDTTANTPAEQGGGERSFRVSDTIGYNERKY